MNVFPTVYVKTSIIGNIMWRDPIVERVRELREQYAARFNHDLKAICQDLRERQKASGRRVVSLPPKRITKAGPARQSAA